MIGTWLSASAYFGILAGLYSFGLFLPTILIVSTILQYESLKTYANKAFSTGTRTSECIGPVVLCTPLRRGLFLLYHSSVDL